MRKTLNLTDDNIIITTIHNDNITAYLYASHYENETTRATEYEFFLIACDNNDEEFYSNRFEIFDDALKALHQFNIDEYNSSKYKRI